MGYGSSRSSNTREHNCRVGRSGLWSVCRQLYDRPVARLVTTSDSNRSVPRISVWWWVCFSLGCGQSLTVTAPMQVPAAVPVRTFPHVVVTAGHEEKEAALADNLARHLSADSQVETQRLGRDVLGALRAQRSLPAASVVVEIELRLRQSYDSRFTTRPQTVCGAGGCFTRNRTISVDVPQLRARVQLTVSSGPSGEVLQRYSFEVLEEGRDWPPMERRALEQTAARLRGLVDSQVQHATVQLRRVDSPEVALALRLMEQGQWRRARITLERAVRGEAAGSLSPKERAKVLYNLHVARRFDPVSLAEDPNRHFEAAAAPLRRAIQLDPSSRYADALRELDAHRARLEQVRRQREAALHNFQLRGQPASSDTSIPSPPPAYR